MVLWFTGVPCMKSIEAHCCCCDGEYEINVEVGACVVIFVVDKEREPGVLHYRVYKTAGLI